MNTHRREFLARFMPSLIVTSMLSGSLAAKIAFAREHTRSGITSAVTPTINNANQASPATPDTQNKPSLFNSGWNERAFSAKKINEINSILGATEPVENHFIKIETNDIADDPFNIPVTISSDIQGTEWIAVMVEGNPTPLVGLFTTPETTEPWFQLNLKMAQTSNIYVLVKATGKYYNNSKEVKITLGDCHG